MPTKSELMTVLEESFPTASPESRDVLADTILSRFAEQISKQEDMPAEFGKLINDYFWDLIMKEDEHGNT
jgi:hypothetical protein